MAFLLSKAGDCVGVGDGTGEGGNLPSNPFIFTLKNSRTKG